MKVVQRICVLFLLLVFLYGTTGMSVLHHSCNSSNEKTLTVYPELFKNAGSSCCSEDETGYVSGLHHCPSENGLPATVDAVPCCKSNISFFKLEILSERAYNAVIAQVGDLITMKAAPVISATAAEQPVLNTPYFQFYSPPLFGKLLIHYLHQMKIPAHSSIA
jgi:hypothetical protein